jgi:RNA polymerase sigma-70 factor (ECF subfamily)
MTAFAHPADASARGAFEKRVRSLCEAGDWHEAVSLVVEGYGPELLGMLVALADSEPEGYDQFSDLCLDICHDLPSFRWQSSLRTWLYSLARHRVLRSRRAPATRLPHLPLSQASELEIGATRARTTTAPYLRTDVKNQFAALRAKLPLDEQMLLILRVDRGLRWRDVAQVLGDSEAALRKRFERLKVKLAHLAKAHRLMK